MVIRTGIFRKSSFDAIFSNRKFGMKKLVLFAVFTFLSACSRFSHEIKLIRPNEIGADENFTNRVFTIFCRENDDFVELFGSVGLLEVDEKCKEFTSKFAFEKGYLYFSVLDKGDGSITSVKSYMTDIPVTTTSIGGYKTSTTYIPQINNYSLTNPYIKYIFVLIKENELKKWKNYYRVLDYFSPESQ